MVKTPKTRHSKSKRDPVTIDLEPSSVSRSSDKTADADKTGKAAAKDTETKATTTGSSAKTQTEASKASSLAPKTPKAADRPAATATTGKSSEAKTERPSASSVPSSGGKATSSGRDAGTSSTTASGTSSNGGSPGSGTTPERPAAPEATPSRGGMGTAVLGGFIGAIVALVLAGALLWAGVLPGTDATGEDAAAIDGLQQEIANLQDELGALRDGAPATGGEEDLADALQRLNALEDTVNTMGGDISQLQEAVASGGAGEGAAVEALQTRLSELEDTVSGLSEGGGAGGADVSVLQERIATLEQDISSTTEAAQAAVSAAEANTERLAALEEQVAALGDRAGSGGESPTARLIAATALKSAIDSGRPFAGELDTFAAVAPEAQELEILRQYADEGVATRTELANQASEAASRMIAATRISGDDAGVLGRLWASAQALVVVRPVGTPQGTDVPSTVARMEAAVESGDYEAALGEYENLPPEAQTAGRDFADRLRARLAADAVVDRSMSDALKAAQG